LNLFRQIKRNLIYTFKRKTNIDKNFLNQNLSLDTLFRNYNCDKGSTFCNEINRFIKGHDYAPFYEKHFNRIKNKKINILEIGVYNGASSASFANYFSNSTIFCLDINLTNFKYFSKKFKVFNLDVMDKKMVSNFLSKNNIKDNEEFFDIIIDDASHKQSNQIKSLFYFFNYLKKNGIYIIEEFTFPNIFPHLNDCQNEYKIDQILNFIINKKVFKSKFINKENISYLIKKTKKINTYKGTGKGSQIAFIEKK